MGTVKTIMKWSFLQDIHVWDNDKKRTEISVGKSVVFIPQQNKTWVFVYGKFENTFKKICVCNYTVNPLFAKVVRFQVKRTMK